MKPIKNLQSKASRCGSALIITLTFGVIVLVMLAGYLWLIQSRSIERQRSTEWNSAIPVLEAGIEEAFTHLKDDGTNNLTANGWVLASGLYQKTRTNADNSYYIVTISNAMKAPVIYSQGFVPAPFGNGYISRKVRVTTATSGNSLFSKAILATTTISFTAGMLIKSYDSTDPNLSNPDGTFNTNKYSANAWVASSAASGQSLKISGTLIYGGVQYSAGATPSVSGSSVGDTAWVNGNSTAGIESGHSDNTLNITVPTTPFPTDSSGNTVDPSTWIYKAPLASAITTNGVSGVKYVLTTGDWSIGSDTFHNESIYIPPGNTVRLYVGKNGRWQMGSSDVIKVSSTSSLQLYNDSSTDAVVTGIANDSGLPTHFYYWGLPDTTGSKLSFTGNGFCAAGIYAYYQLVVFTGGSSSTGMDLYGALVANAVTSSGHFWMAYDQALGNLGGGNPTTFTYQEL